jgi:tRNA (guanine37-N1)-methyltransferase
MKLHIDVITIFPEMIRSYAGESILGRAQAQGLLSLGIHDLRDGAHDARRSVDDTPFGGGPGMVLTPGPIASVIGSANGGAGVARPLIALTPSGKQFTQAHAKALADSGSFSLLCGRYEGFDQRVLDDDVDEEFSIGDFVLAGGELAGLVIIEAAARLIPGVLGNEESPLTESFAEGLLEYPQYTKPQEFSGASVPPVLLSGDHGRIASWRLAKALERTLERRPDLIEARGGLSAAEMALLQRLDELEGAPKSD